MGLDWTRCVWAALVLGASGCAGGDTSSTSGGSFGGSFTAGASAGASAGATASASGNDDGFDSTEPLDTSGNDGVTGDPPAEETGALETGGGSGGPVTCGDGIANGGESCDGEDLGGQTCADFGFEEGTLVCDSECNILTDGCRICGDDMLAASELCDGTNLGGETCVSQGFGGGTLQCDPECDGFITTGCSPLPSCGDGVRNGGEQCDGADLGGATCQTLGFDTGSLGCNAGSCTHNTANCEFLDCGSQGDFCLFDPDNPQGTCCPPGVGGNLLGICALAICQ